MNRRNFLLAIPFLAVAIIMDEVGMCRIADPRMIELLSNHPRNAARNKRKLLFTTVE